MTCVFSDTVVSLKMSRFSIATLLAVFCVFGTSLGDKHIFLEKFDDGGKENFYNKTFMNFYNNFFKNIFFQMAGRKGGFSRSRRAIMGLSFWTPANSTAMLRKTKVLHVSISFKNVNASLNFLVIVTCPSFFKLRDNCSLN